jgi:hypothetical protein
VDLGDLCSALMLWGNDATRPGTTRAPGSTASSSGRGTAEGKPLRWVGYELSAYCVAKAAVIAIMLESGAEVEGVLQVGERNLHVLCRCVPGSLRP